MSDSDPLSSYFNARGVAATTWRGAAVPEAFDDVAREVAAARGGAALASLSWLTHVRVRGRHRARFLHNMTTCDIKGLEAGDGNFGLFVDRRGRVVSDIQIEHEGDTLLLELPRDLADDAITHVVQYRVADDVHFDPVDDRAVLALVGPRSDVAMAQAVGEDVARTLERDGAFRDVTLGEVTARVRRNGRRVGLPGWDVTVAAADAPAAWEALEKVAGAPIGASAWHTLRVEAGWPEIGVDLTNAHTPLESDRLYATVDWDKGCYVGQEVIAMTHYRGKPNKRLVPMAITPATADVELGGDVTLDGKVVGRLGSVISSPTLGGLLGLAVIKRKTAAPDTAVELPGDAAGVVLPWPIGPNDAPSA